MARNYKSWESVGITNTGIKYRSKPLLETLDLDYKIIVSDTFNEMRWGERTF